MSTTRKQSVVLEGKKYPLIYLTPNTYKELFESAGQYASKLNLRTQGHDPNDPHRHIVVEMKAFLFNGFAFAAIEE